jgi:hypothetical protein
MPRGTPGGRSALPEKQPIAGEQVSPLRAKFTPRYSRRAPVEAAESSYEIAVLHPATPPLLAGLRRQRGDLKTTP